MVDILIPGKTQIDDVTDPYYLEKLLGPAFTNSMDGIKDMRDNYVPCTNGIDLTVSLPYPVWLLLTMCFPNPKEFHEHILPRIAKIHPEYRVANR